MGVYFGRNLEMLQWIGLDWVSILVEKWPFRASFQSIMSQIYDPSNPLFPRDTAFGQTMSTHSPLRLAHFSQGFPSLYPSLALTNQVLKPFKGRYLQSLFDAKGTVVRQVWFFMPFYLLTALSCIWSDAVPVKDQIFLAVHRQLNRTACPLVCRSGTTNNQILHDTKEWP